jgi:uncharacterized protein YndB with AHSA1/START domain
MPMAERSVEIMAPPATVWSLLATQEGLRRWLDPGIEIEMKVGGAHRHYVSEFGIWIVGRVLEIVPERELVLSWMEEGTDWMHPIRLSFTLAEIPGGTRVTQRYDGFAGIGKESWERTYQSYQRGMERHGTLEKLKGAVEAA